MTFDWTVFWSFAVAFFFASCLERRLTRRRPRPGRYRRAHIRPMPLGEPWPRRSEREGAAG